LQGIQEGANFYAETLAFYPDSQRSTEAYLRKVVRQQLSEGFEQVGGPSGTRLGQAVFARSDFKKGAVYEAIFVKACEAYVFVFIFSGNGADSVKKLIVPTDLKLDSQKSRCSS